MDRTGQIGLVRTRGFFAWFYCFFGRSPVSHVVVGLPGGKCIGAEPGGVRVRDIAEYDEIVWSEFDLSTREKYLITRYVREKLTTPYSYLTVFFLALEVVSRIRTPTWIERYLSTEYAFECAQLAHAAYLAAGKDLLGEPDRLPGRVRPDLFVPVFRRLGWVGAWW
jgi:hypothetical protein